MSSRQLTSRLINEVQQQLQGFKPQRSHTDREQLSALTKAIMGSVDVRDLRGIPSHRLLHQFEDLLELLSQRKRGEIKVELRYQDDTDTLVVESCVEDQPFLVSTMRAAIGSERYEIRRQVNAIVRVRRNPAGKLIGIGTGQAESLMRIEVATPSGSSGGRDGGGIPVGLRERIADRLALAQAMVRDFERMSACIESVADGYFAVASDLHGAEGSALRESEALLRWLCDENFVIFAVERYDAEGSRVEALGTSTIAAPERAPALRVPAPAPGRFIRYERSAEESPVHRSGKPGYFVATAFDDDGNPSGVVLVEGLFTYKALHTPPEQIPVINTVLDAMLEDRQVASASARGKSITNAFNSLPLEYLLCEGRESIWELTDRILRAEAEGGSDVHIRIGDGSRFAFAFVALPRWQFSEELRQQVQDVLLQDLGGSYADYGVYIDRYDNAVIHFYVTGVGPLHEADTEALRARVLAHARSWGDRLREAVEAVAPEGRADEIFEIYEDAFNEEHKRRCSVERIKGDVLCLESLREGARVTCDLYVSEFGDHPGSLNLRTFAREPINLSRELPVLSSFGFEVIDEYSREIHVPHLPTIDMDNFRFDVRTSHIGRIMARRGNIVAALREVFEGRAGDDDLNRLIVVSDLTARDVDVLRAYVAHMHQLRLPFDVAVIRSALVDHPSVAVALMQWLAARFDPRVASPALAESTETTLAKELREVTDYTADRVLQAVAELFRATRRTNAYVADRDAGEAMAFKVAAWRLSYGPEPKPYREIWVSHPDFEGVHLRGGKVARGGLRFSDRPDDFRTEIHGLMSTQMVKNVLIVPMGAKGGFVLRRPPVEREALRAAGDYYYGKFIRALLSVTDNVVDGEAITPEGILVHREDKDPYLVVAADKGTAHLSDTANAISAEHGFWLDDAFASGGSNGYDHKKTGITARGAWEVTRRAFNELGIDPQTDEITAVGVGDMSGDVFGNGLLRSRTVKLVAAFNHIHIFIDPDPDPARSFEERQRMFDLPRSTWEDYGVLSEGGGVYPRKSKEVPLSPRARQLLGIEPDRVVGGDEVIRAILQLPVDLLWMGGIGTYIKAKEESNGEVGDKANDSVRVDACELRSRVLAEGANLAITDRGRAEFARGGGQNYNAFLDNSGGVDTSDHEVNIKILFAPLLAAGTITREARNAMLVECEREVVEMVLANNRSQSRMVSFDVAQSRADVFRYSRALRTLAAKVPFNPESFSLAGEDELQNRTHKGQGLYKCEAAVLCSHAKMLAYRELLAGAPLPDGIVDRYVRAYFPRPLAELAGDEAVAGHLLRREIATTMVVNDIVDNMGGAFLTELQVGTLMSPVDIVVAYLRGADAADLRAIQADLYALEDKRSMKAIYEAMAFLQHSLEDATFYLLDQMDLPPIDDAGLQQVRSLLADVGRALPAGSRGRTAKRRARFVELGLPEALAGRIVELRYLTPVLDAVRLAPSVGRSPADTLLLRLKVTDAINFNDLNQAIDRMVLTSPWDGPSVAAMRRQLNFHVHKLVRMVKGDDVSGMVEAYGLGEFAAQVREQAETNPTISGMVMLDDWLRRLLPPLAELPKNGG
ncbi:MAG: NAD-glutamate dehydrogenase [Myxococcales bacterium]|nr:NAD-glutamate dehydrogenase [Myxococcales bacterium]